MQRSVQNQGDGWIADVSARPGAMVGTWHVECCELGRRDSVFVVQDPAGRVVGRALIGRPFVGPVNFLIVPADSEFEHGDAFDIVVTFDRHLQCEVAHHVVPSQEIEARDPVAMGERSAHQD